MVIGWLTGRTRPGLPVRCALRNPCCFIGMGLLLGRFSQDRVEAAAGASSNGEIKAMAQKAAEWRQQLGSFGNGVSK